MKTGLIIEMLETGDIKPHPENRIVATSGETWDEFRESIKCYGIKQPLLVRPTSEGYEIVAGERRWRAARSLGMSHVPAIAEAMTDSGALSMMLIENLQRVDLDPCEEARGVRLLIERAGLTVEEVSSRIHRSIEWVGLRQGLLDLPVEAQEFASRREVSLGVLGMVLHLPVDRREEALQLVLHPQFQESPLNARQAQQIIDSKIIEPARAKKEWELRMTAMSDGWAVFLGCVAKISLENPDVLAAPYDLAAPSNSVVADDDVPTIERSQGAPKDLKWLHLAQRHGVPIMVHPATNDNEGALNNSIPLINHSLIMAGERALEDNERGSAWLSSASKKKAKIMPDEVEDEVVEIRREILDKPDDIRDFLDYLDAHGCPESADAMIDNVCPESADAMICDVNPDDYWIVINAIEWVLEIQGK